MIERRLKVLMDGRPIRAPISGVGQHVCSVAMQLAGHAEIDLRLLTLEFGQRSPLTEFELPTASVRHVRRVPRKLFNIAVEHLNWPVAEWAAGRADLVHHTFFGWLPMARGTAVVSTIHDVIPIEQPEKFTRTNAYYSRKNFWRQLRDSHAIIAVSDYTKARIVDVGGLDDEAAARIEVIPNGVRDLSAQVSVGATDELRERWGIRRPYVLYVGNIEPRKGVSTLLRAFRRLPAAADLQLVIAGRKCWGYEEVEAVARDFPAEQLVMPGYISEREKAVLMSGAHIFVYPSTYEGFGIPVLEAMQCGCPVIAAENTSLTELCRGAGVLFQTESVEDLCEKLSHLIRSEQLRRECIAAGRIRAARYTWENVAAETVKVYRTAMTRV